jgi:phosphomethylpyrimidine synthase
MIISGNIRNPKKINLSEETFPVIFMHVGVGECDELDKAIEIERYKIQEALKLGVDVICDVSLAKNMKYVHEKLLKDFDCPFGLVTGYEAYIEAEKNDLIYESHRFVELFEEHIKRGFDIITIHATVLKNDQEFIKNSNRLISTTSRGGMMMLKMMEKNNYENPFFIYFDEILDLAKKYNVAISLGPCYRPASVCDCDPNDSLTLLELERMSYLVEKAIKKDVGITIEGIGHAPLNKINEMIKKAKEKCFNVPYRVMTVSTDIALGYDHISSAISSAMAIYCGASSITCVSRSEHIGIPTVEESLEGVQAAIVAAYSGYIARTGDLKRDEIMSIAREKNGCLGHIPSTLFPEYVVKELKKKNCKREGKSCTMCGDYCPLNKL